MPSNITRIRFLFLSLLLILLLLAIVVPTCFVSQESGPARDQWQRPQAVMDALGVAQNGAVADVGAGDGYFTFHLAHRVGTKGKVYAVDIQENDLVKIRHRAEEEHLSQIETIHGDPDNPKLPAESLDAILVINSYHEFRAYDAMLRGLRKALKPSGLLAIIDSPTERSSSRQEYYNRHRIPEEVVREEAARAGFRFLRKEPGFKRPRNSKEFYFLIFEKAEVRTQLSSGSLAVNEVAPTSPGNCLSNELKTDDGVLKKDENYDQMDRVACIDSPLLPSCPSLSCGPPQRPNRAGNKYSR